MKRKTEIAEGHDFPDARRRAVVLDELVSDYGEATERKGKAIMRTDIGYQRLLERFGGRRADSITPGEVEEWQSDYGKHERGDYEPSPTTIARGPASRCRQSHATARRCTANKVGESEQPTFAVLGRGRGVQASAGTAGFNRCSRLRFILVCARASCLG